MRQWSGLISMIGGDRVLVRDYWELFGVVRGGGVLFGGDRLLLGGGRG